jgi:phosphatidylserine/phosphatidylglycerophosphate/cardiolipin synthase-like enzyme
MTQNQVQVAVTGLGWMGHGIGSVETAMEVMLITAKREILMTAYSAGGGGLEMLDHVVAAARRGVNVRIIVNRFATQDVSVRARLDEASKFTRFSLYAFEPANNEDLHAKVLIVDREQALVGSANLSRNGLKLNYELALRVQGPAANQTAQAIDRLLEDQRVRQIA